MNGLLWLLLLVGPLLILQRLLHREIQGIFLLLTRRPEIAYVLFALLFFPGVVLHETSHYLMALLLGVRVGRVSLIPRVLPGENAKAMLQLGFVETAQTDFLRDALIGAAPLISGGIFVAFTGLRQLGLNEFWLSLTQGGIDALGPALARVYAYPDFWLWFYLIFAISSTMLPSASDRRGWLPVGLIFLALLAITLFAGAGPWLMQYIEPYFNQAMLALAAVVGISAAVHLVLILPVYLLRAMISKATGLEVR